LEAAAKALQALCPKACPACPRQQTVYRK